MINVNRLTEWGIFEIPYLWISALCFVLSDFVSAYLVLDFTGASHSLKDRGQKRSINLCSFWQFPEYKRKFDKGGWYFNKYWSISYL